MCSAPSRNALLNEWNNYTLENAVYILLSKCMVQKIVSFRDQNIERLPQALSFLENYLCSRINSQIYTWMIHNRVNWEGQNKRHCGLWIDIGWFLRLSKTTALVHFAHSHIQADLYCSNSHWLVARKASPKLEKWSITGNKCLSKINLPEK